MAKMITRTIKVYTYTFGKYDFKSGKCNDIEQRSFPYKLQKREEDKLTRSTGKALLDVSTGEALYGMSLEDFMRYAKPVSKAEAETGLDVKE